MTVHFQMYHKPQRCNATGRQQMNLTADRFWMLILTITCPYSLSAALLLIRSAALLSIASYTVGVKQRSWQGPQSFAVGSSPTSRWKHGFASHNGKLFVFGGLAQTGGALGDLYSFNPTSLAWARLSDYSSGIAPTPRLAHGFASAGGLLFVVGGVADSSGGTLEWTDITNLVVGEIPQHTYSSVLASAQGMLYLFGGEYSSTGGEWANALHRYDPAAMRWSDISATATGPAPTPRLAPAMTSAGGALFVFGGARPGTNTLLRDLYRFELSTLSWSNLTAAVRGTTRPTARDGASFAHLNGILYLLGSSSSSVDDSFLFDLETLVWKSVSLGSISRGGFWQPLVTTDDAVYSFGGYSAASTASPVPGQPQGSSGATMRRLDLSTLAWTNFAGTLQGTTPSRRMRHGFVAVNGDLYVHGGLGSQGTALGDLLQVDLATLTLSDITGQSKGTIPVARYLHGFAAAQDKLFVYGGLSLTGKYNNETLIRSDLLIFDPQINLWTDLSIKAIGSSPSARHSAGFASLGNMLFVFGGVTSTGLVNDLHRFDPMTMSWSDLTDTTLGTAPAERQLFGFAGTGNKLYVAMGISSIGLLLDDLISLDVATLAWTNLSQMTTGVSPGARQAAGVAAGAGKLFVFAGLDSSGNFLNDLFALDLSSLHWVNLGAQLSTSTSAPQARASVGLVYSSGKLFLCAGYDRIGPKNDLIAVPIAAKMQWPENGSSDFFIEFYDWDVLVLSPTSTMVLSWRLQICGGYFPCALSIVGAGGEISRVGGGSVSCLSSTGCSVLDIQSVHFRCDDEYSTYALLEVGGTSIGVENSTFIGCSSEIGGGALYAYGGAVVSIHHSSFLNTKSVGEGGAIRVVGSTISITSTVFENCMSLNGGGAVSAAEYQCSQAGDNTNTMVAIEACTFRGCRTYGSGGAIRVAGTTVKLMVSNTVFSKCSSLGAGGGIAANESATVQIVDSVFRNNTASGTGGGAVYSADAILTLSALSCAGNAAPNGGGGVLFWSGIKPTIVQWCDAGSEHSAVMECTPSGCEPTCMPCRAGSFQTSEGNASCLLCASGKYSTALGATAASTCLPCVAGKYSTGSGANNSATCVACGAGEYSEKASAENCSQCSEGTYSNTPGATSSSVCSACSPGKFSTALGSTASAACSTCAAGTFSAVSGSSMCTGCRAGSFGTSFGATSVIACTKCSVGTYSASTGSSICSLCSDNNSSQQSNITLCDARNLNQCDSPGLCQFSCDQGSLLEHPIASQIGSSYLRSWTIVPNTVAMYINLSVEIIQCCSKVDVQECDSFGCRQILVVMQRDRGFVSLLSSGSVVINFFVSNASNESSWGVKWNTERAGQTSCSTCSVGGSSCDNISVSNSSAASRADSSHQNVGTPSGDISFLIRGMTENLVESKKFQALAPSEYKNALVEQPNTKAHLRNNDIRESRSAVFKLRCDRLVANLYESLALTKLPLFRTISNSPSHPVGNVVNHLLLNALKFEQSKRMYTPAGSVIDQAGHETAPAARKLHTSTNSNPRRQFCGPENSASYGPCLATPYNRLEVLGWPVTSKPSYCGVPFELQLLKKDIYNQIVASDNSSLLQTLSSLGGQSLADPYVSVAGSSVASLQAGRAVVSCVVKPSFSRLIASEGRTDFASLPYIYFKGIDSETLVPMDITPVLVHLSNGTAVCPPGYILVLEKTINDVARQGTCSECGTGTYSVNPLAGITLSTPSCFNCPANAICSGGMSVQFSLGTWRVLGGMYRLVGCPRAYQLVNSIQGVFSHDIQQCVACQSNQYVLDSNNSNFTCQTCPAGAVCDGNNLTPLVAGSIWEADVSKGQYLLVSCPPGYERKADTQESQTCDRCPLSYYCLGGTAPSTACAGGTFAPAGSNASSACFAVVFVSVSVSLPISRSEFNATLQQKFREALAEASGVDVGRVVIDSITQARRSDIHCEPSALHQAVDVCTFLSTKSNAVLDLSSTSLPPVENGAQDVHLQDAASVVGMRRAVTSSIQVSSKVAAESSDSAVLLSSRLNTATVNALLVSRGLPEGSVQSVAVLSPPAQGGGGTPVALIAGVAAGGFTVLVLMSVGGYCLSRKLRVQAAHRAFLNAFRSAKAGDKATPQHLPYALRKFYVPQQILGRGAFGVVVQAKTKQGGQGVAIKIVVPEKGIFEDRDVRQLRREAMVLDTFTQNLIDTAVHLVGSEAVHIQPEICWFVMELLLGDNMEAVIKDPDQGPISDMECIKVARNILAALKIMHADGLVHRDIKPANIMRCARKNSGEAGQGTMFTYSLVDFGTALGVDETVAKETMMTLAHNRNMGAGTQPYMSPEMFKAPDTAKYPTDIWSLGVTLFELVTGRLPFEAESDLLWSVAVAGNMSEKAPYVLDMLGEDRRSKFDNSLAKVIAKSLEKRVEDRYQSVDEMHEAVYQCLIVRGEATYSVFISYRVGSEAPFARLLFDELNHSVTPAGNRVTVYWDAHRLVKGEDWEEGFATGLLNSLCFIPLMSYGATAPLAALPPPHQRDELLAAGWDEAPLGRSRLQGAADDAEDNVLKEYLIAEALLERRAALEKNPSERGAKERGLLQLAYPVLIGRQHPKGHPDYPRMGSFFQVQGGGGKYPSKTSPPTNESVVRFLRNRAGANEATLSKVRDRTVASTVSGMTALQGCQMWAHPPDLEPADLTKEQRALVGKGYAGPAVVLGDGDAGALTEEQRRELAGCGLDEAQLRMLKAEIRYRRSDFHEIIDRAVNARAHAEEREGVLGGSGISEERIVSGDSLSAAAVGGDLLIAGESIRKPQAEVTVTSEPGPMWVEGSIVGTQRAVIHPDQAAVHERMGFAFA